MGASSRLGWPHLLAAAVMILFQSAAIIFASSRRPITFCYVGSNGIRAQTPQEI
jgi:hypothetical protein